MDLYYDVPKDDYDYGKVFCRIEGDKVTFDPDSKYPKEFKHSIGFISYAISHSTATMDRLEIYHQTHKEEHTPTCEDYFAHYFNESRKGGGDTSWLCRPYDNWRDELQRRGEYVPPKGKYFTTGYYRGLYMFISPKKFVYVIRGKKKAFGKQVSCWTREWYSAEKIVELVPRFKKHLPYLQWLENEANIGRIKPKGNGISINQQELKKWLKK